MAAPSNGQPIEIRVYNPSTYQRRSIRVKVRKISRKRPVRSISNAEVKSSFLLNRRENFYHKRRWIARKERKLSKKVEAGREKLAMEKMLSPAVRRWDFPLREIQGGKSQWRPPPSCLPWNCSTWFPLTFASALLHHLLLHHLFLLLSTNFLLLISLPSLRILNHGFRLPLTGLQTAIPYP